MSNALAIAAVTTMLDYLVTQTLARSIDVDLESVTAKPLDKARDGGESTNQVNIFLYQTLHNSAWRNRDIPSRVRPGETGRSPLALNLSYLITAYGKSNDDIEGQRLLGMAMQTLHDHAEIRPQDIERAISSTNLERAKRELLASSDLKNQIERIRITPQVLSIEEVSKMWGTFQAPYRISAAYEASVVLIESSRPVKTPLPVLSRGSDDRGGIVQPDLIPAFPTLETLAWPSQQLGSQSSITLNETLTLRGHHLAQTLEPAVLRFINPTLDNPIVLTIPSPAAVLTVALTDAIAADWVAGFYTVSLQYGEGALALSSNALSIAIAPQITLLLPAARILTENTLTLTCQPPVQAGQRVSLLLGSQEIALDLEFQDMRQREPNPPPVNSLSFELDKVADGDYIARLRVDGVDSHVVMRTPEGRLAFDSQYRFTIARGNA